MNDWPSVESAGEAAPGRRPYVLRTEPDGLYALLNVPERPRGLVVFVHDDFPFSPVDYRIATYLRAANFATLMVDFLSSEEQEDDSPDEFDIELVAERLDRVTEWAVGLQEFRNMPFAYFATGVGGAAAVASASQNGALVGAMCLMGGRGGLSEERLIDVHAPILFIAPASDRSVADCAQHTPSQSACRRKLILLNGASDDVSRAAHYSRRWFSRHLS